MKTNSSLLLLLSALTLNFNCMANDSKGATGADEITRPQRAAVKVVQTAGRTALGDFAPEFAHLNDDILFGEVWSRNDLLSLRDRSMITMTALIAQESPTARCCIICRMPKQTAYPAQRQLR